MTITEDKKIKANLIPSKEKLKVLEEIFGLIWVPFSKQVEYILIIPMGVCNDYSFGNLNSIL